MTSKMLRDAQLAGVFHKRFMLGSLQRLNTNVEL